MPNIRRTSTILVAAGQDDAQYDSIGYGWVYNSTPINLGTSGSAHYEIWLRFNTQTVPAFCKITSATLAISFNAPVAMSTYVHTAVDNVYGADWTSYPGGSMSWYGNPTSWNITASGSNPSRQTTSSLSDLILWLQNRSFPIQNPYVCLKVVHTASLYVNRAYAYEYGSYLAGLAVTFVPLWRHRRCWGDRFGQHGWGRPAKLRLRDRAYHERHLLLPD